MATLTEHKGRLLLDFSWKGQRCREYLGLDASKEGRAKARQIQRQVEGQIAGRTLDYATWFPRSKKVRPGGRFAPPPPPPSPEGPPGFATFARAFLEGRKVFSSHAHYLDLTSLLETHLIPTFGADAPVSDQTFTIEACERLVTRMKALPGLKAETMSSVRVNKARNLLRKILDRAIKKGWLQTNPVEEVPRLRENPADIDPLSWTSVQLLLDKGLKHDPEMQRFYTVAVFTGLRTSELIGLKWSDLDWTGPTPLAVIKHSFTKRDGQHLTKTPGSARAVELRPQAARALKAQQAASRLKSEFVFCNRDGGPLDRDNLMNRVWYPALTRAGIRERTPYQTRHTFATLALASGEAIGWVANQLGHASTKMIIEHYYRFIPNLTRQDGSAFDKAAAQAGL
jgi:integrase